MTITFFDKTLNCKEIKRTGANSVECRYITDSGNTDTAKFDGITDMTLFKISDDGATYTAADLPIPDPEPDKYELLEGMMYYIGMKTGVL